MSLSVLSESHQSMKLSVISKQLSSTLQREAATSSLPVLFFLRTFSKSSHLKSSDEDFAQARKWYAALSTSPSFRNVGELSYSRSSGPGGQNVNKVNSKAQLRVSLDELLPLVPSALHHALRSSRYYADKTNSVLIQSDESRKQQENRETCYRKLTGMLIDIYKSTVPGETSQGQKDKVRRLQRAENEGRLRLKKAHSTKKAGRSKGSFD